MALPRPVRDMVMPHIGERLNPRQRQRVLQAAGRIISAADEIAAVAEERDGVMGMLILGFAQAIRDRGEQLKGAVE